MNKSAIPKESMPIIIPQVIIPVRITRVDFHTRSCRRVAISEAVQAPVPGIGRATKKNSPKSSALSTFFAFLFPWSIIFWNIHPIFLNLESHTRTVFANFIRNGTGRIFPRTQQRSEGKNGISATAAYTIAPRSSMSGTIDIRKR